ncbi:MAG: helix-turn-helix transcriptional regulator [Prevotella sp.]|nr:helix-turn-helix transcriptional regulator [Prevotella sp.]
MKFNIERLKEVAKPASAEALQEDEYRRQNWDWLEKSALIALDIHAYLRKNNISKQEFARLLEVSPAQVTKLLSGKENLGLKTISKIESVLQMDLVAIPNYEHFYTLHPVMEAKYACEDIAAPDSD